MGLIQAALGAAGGVLADQWKEFFYCDSIPEDTLMAKGYKRTTGRSSNTRGNDNIISNGSVIAVADGQCMAIVEQGKVVEFCAEPGEFVWDSSTEPSIFTGKFGDSLIATFKAIGRRFTFGGDPGKDQRVYYFNTKEIIGNKYGTASPVPFRVVDNRMNFDIDISIRCNGEYSYRLCDPILFYTNIAGNVEDMYTRDRLDSQLKAELLTALQPAFAKISEMGIRYSALPAHTTELADALNEVLSDKWRGTRGIEIASFAVNSVTASKEDEDRIKNIQTAYAMRDPTMGAAVLTNATATAVMDAANNPNGAGMGFMGVGMGLNVGAANISNMYAQGAAQQPTAPAAPAAPAAPVDAGWTCPSCGKTGNTGKFCSECGKPKPEAPKKVKCPKCGWEPADGATPGKFCPECGTKLD